MPARALVTALALLDVIEVCELSLNDPAPALKNVAFAEDNADALTVVLAATAAVATRNRLLIDVIVPDAVCVCVTVGAVPIFAEAKAVVDADALVKKTPAEAGEALNAAAAAKTDTESLPSIRIKNPSV